jgi:hypothetical protein
VLLLTRFVTAALLAVVTVLSVGTPARADAVAPAQARVDSLQKLAQDSTAALTEGTRAWEADQARLRLVKLDLANTQRRITAAQATADLQRAKVGSLARQLFMRRAPSPLSLAMTRGPSEVLSALQVQQGLNVSAGSQGQIIARAQTAQHRLRSQEQLAQQLVTEAAALAKASARRLAGLNALADRTSAQLTQAQDTLSAALTARAEARARAAPAQRRASRSRVVFLGGGGAACTGKPTGGQANGNLDPGSLCPLWRAPGQRLRADAAGTFNAMSHAYFASTGAPLCVTDSYRSYSEQVAVYHQKPGLAAVPGSSNHGWGLAVDFCGGVQDTGSAAYRWMKANAGRFGWFHPDWAEPGGSRPEAWHWEFHG